MIFLLLLVGCGTNQNEEKILFCSPDRCESYENCNETYQNCTLASNRCTDDLHCTENDNGNTVCNQSTHNCIAPEMDPCENITCSDHGVCGVIGENTICACDSGYHAEALSCIIDQIDLCKDVTCDLGFICVDGECNPESSALTIATYNLHDLNYSDAYNGVANMINDHNVDIALFQEIQLEDKSPLQEALAVAGVNMPYVAYTSRGGYGGDDGDDYIACFSRVPITYSETIIDGFYQDPISGDYFSMDSLRPVLQVDITSNNTPITLYGLHLKAHYPFPDCPECIKRRRAQAHALEQFILNNQSPEEDLILVAGDVNSAIDTDFEQGQTIDMLSLKSDNNTANDLTPTNLTFLPENSWTHNNYDSRLDHIFLSPKLLQYYRSDSIDVLSIPYPYPSDHKPVILTVDLP